MTVVLVHGNPETSAIWNDLIPHLISDDVRTISPPGFGVPVPKGFEPTMDGYLEWLINEICQIDSPVDLVGHDWGGGHVVRLACERPDLIRSWASDIMGVFTPDYVWHERARIWQTPGAGEDSVAAMIKATPEETTERFHTLGMSKPIAREVAQAINDDMGRCVLKLYRSAAQPIIGDLFGSLKKATVKPGLAIVATEDPFVVWRTTCKKSCRSRWGGGGNPQESRALVDVYRP
tara:strand:- start:384 stop:1085 length:702 start_codon:yes stop_codon:yes gene_type:complete